MAYFTVIFIQFQKKTILQTLFFVLVSTISHPHICSMKLYSQQNPLPMMRLSNYKTALQKYSLAFLLAFSLPFLAKADVGITVVTTQVGNEVTADFLVYNFDEIVSMQFTMQWEETELQYSSTTNYALPGLSVGNFGSNQANSGLLAFSWVDPNTNGINALDCSRIFSIKFDAISTQIPPIVINGSFIPIEILNADFQLLTLTQDLGCANVGQIVGNVFNDLNDDCLLTPGEVGLEDWVVSYEQNGVPNYVTSDENGDYTAYVLPGEYHLSLHVPQNNLWAFCQYSIPVVVAESQTVTANFGSQAIVDCPQLTVDIAAPFLRRCFESTYHVNYCNEGTMPAVGAYVEVTLDPDLEFVASSTPFASQNGQTFSFPIGDVPLGQCGSFSVTVLVSCEAAFGQTHCSEAHIFPDDICETDNQLWDGSILEVVGNCDGDSVHFTIQNIGDDMLSPVGFIVIEDDMVNFEGSPIQLEAGESYVVTVPANGSTWRVQLDGLFFNPFSSGTPGFSVEGCGVNGNGTFSLGFVTQFPQGAGILFEDVDCQPNVDSYDPNDKTGYPSGYCAAHYIEPNQDIEYRIRFQNTGTAPAINVVILDTLPAALNPASVLPGASSHAYDFELLGNGVVKFTFPDIMLPDSNANEAASHGFVNFTVSQFVDNADGTVISNQAAIYFDFNEPIFTNFYTHTVAEDFVQSAGTDGDLSVSGQVKTWYGAPVQDVEVTLVPTCPVFTDSDGSFEFLELDTADYVLLARKPNLDKQEGVTVLDMVKMTKFILGTQSPNEIYQTIAADVNGSGSVTTFDLVEQRKMAIGLESNGVNDFWRLAHEDFLFPLNNPFSVPFPNGYEIEMLDEDLDNIDIIAMKPGDVIHESMVDSSIVKPHFFFEASPVQNGQLTVSLKVNDFYYMQGFQFGLKWDADALNFTSLENVVGDTYHNANIPGEIQLLTFGLGGNQSLPDSSTIFTMLFDVNGSIGGTSPFTLDQSLLPFQIVVEDCKLAGATMGGVNFVSQAFEPERSGFQVNVMPNPATVGQAILITTKSELAQSIKLQIFDTSGKLKLTWKGDVPAGISSFELEPSLASGFYLLRIVGEKGESAALKLVIK